METTVDVDAVLGGLLSIGELEDRICSRSANLTAAEGEWLLLVAEFDRRLGWERSGHRSCAHWLAWEVGLDLRTAYEKLRVAHVLVEFPELAAAMVSGVLAYAKARAITRIVRADNVDELLVLAATSTANQVENVVACYRRTEVSAEAAAARAFRERALSWRLDGASAVITVRLPVDMASELSAALSEFVDYNDVDTPESVRRVDALMLMADMAVVGLDDVVGPTTRPRYLANLHLTADVFDTTPATDADPADSPDPAETTDPTDSAGSFDDAGCARSGGARDGSHQHRAGGGLCCVQPGGRTHIPPAGVAPSSARRMLCDAVMQGFRTNAEGEAEVGMATPVVSRRLRRALRLRDGGCRFPGCTMAAWVDAHHIQHWIDLGPTRPKNLVCLCRRHHRLMHEGGWNITGDPAGELFFHQPDGTMIAAQPPIRHGDAGLVNVFGLTAKQGRCGWTTRRCDYSLIAEMILDTERARRRSRSCTHRSEMEPASSKSP